MFLKLKSSLEISTELTRALTDAMELEHHRRMYASLLVIADGRLLTFGLQKGFISQSWRITSRGMFAGCCIGVVLLVMCLEFFRRLSKEYDRYILQQYKRQITFGGDAISHRSTRRHAKHAMAPAASDSADENNEALLPADVTTRTFPEATVHMFRPTLIQQSLRALLHMVTFAIAYFVMLLAMYYNGYFIICIFIGAYLGAFVFTWETIGVSIGYDFFFSCCMYIN